MVFPREALQLLRKPTKRLFSSGRFAIYLRNEVAFMFFFCIQLIHFVLPITLSHLSVLEIFAVGHMFRMVAKKKKIFFFYASQKSLAELPEWWIANSPFSVVLLQSRDTRIEYQIIQAHKPLRILGLFGPMYHLKVRDTNGSVPVLFCYW